MIKRYNRLVDHVDRYLMAGKNRRARVEKAKPLFVAVIRTVLRDVAESIMSGRCPYCGASIKPRGYMAIHIRRVHYSRYYSDIVRAVDAYIQLVSMLVHSGNGWVINMNGVVLKGNKGSIARRIEEDPTILERLGVV